MRVHVRSNRAPKLTVSLANLTDCKIAKKCQSSFRITDHFQDQDGHKLSVVSVKEYVDSNMTQEATEDDQMFSINVVEQNVELKGTAQMTHLGQRYIVVTVKDEMEKTAVGVVHVLVVECSSTSSATRRSSSALLASSSRA